MGPSDHDDEQTARDWRCWRLELAAYGKYVEVSFEDVTIRTPADVRRWAREMSMAFGHYRRPVDLLLDLRGIQIAARCAAACGDRLRDLLERHAASVSFYGAEGWTLAAFEPTLQAWGASQGGRDRADALALLLDRREHRQSPDEESGSVSARAQAREWERSETTSPS